jgi:HEPN domain-containing protein
VLLDAAERDVGALRVMRRSHEISDGIFGFHVQQAAEKSLKAGLALLGKVYPLTHNLKALLELFSEGKDVSRRFRKLIDYTPYAVASCYEGVESGTDSIDRKGALTLVEALLAHVRRQLADTQSS